MHGDQWIRMENCPDRPKSCGRLRPLVRTPSSSKIPKDFFKHFCIITAENHSYPPLHQQNQSMLYTFMKPPLSANTTTDCITPNSSENKNHSNRKPNTNANRIYRKSELKNTKKKMEDTQDKINQRKEGFSIASNSLQRKIVKRMGPGKVRKVNGHFSRVIQYRVCNFQEYLISEFDSVDGRHVYDNNMRQSLEEVNIEAFYFEEKSEIGGANKYIQFTLRGTDRNGSINVTHKYSDFLKLREQLVLQWPGCHIPTLPSKKRVGRTDVFLQNRRQELQNFLVRLSKYNQFWQSNCMRQFLHGSRISLQKIKTQQLHKIYMNRYDEYYGMQINRELNIKIVNWNEEIKRQLNQLNPILQIVQQFYNRSNQYIQQYQHFILDIIPSYQIFCISSLNNKFIGIFQHANITQNFNAYRNTQNGAFAIQLLEIVYREIRELTAFSDVIKVRGVYEAAKQKSMAKTKALEMEEMNIVSGKQSLITRIKRKTKEEQLQQNSNLLKDAKIQQKYYTDLAHIINCLIGFREINSFKKTRAKGYLQFIRNVATKEKEAAIANRNIWRTAITLLESDQIVKDSHNKEGNTKNKIEKRAQEQKKKENVVFYKTEQKKEKGKEEIKGDIQGQGKKKKKKRKKQESTNKKDKKNTSQEVVKETNEIKNVQTQNHSQIDIEKNKKIQVQYDAKQQEHVAKSRQLLENTNQQIDIQPKVQVISIPPQQKDETKEKKEPNELLNQKKQQRQEEMQVSV